MRSGPWKTWAALWDEGAGGTTSNWLVALGAVLRAVWNESTGCLYRINGDSREGAIRPNRVFASLFPRTSSDSIPPGG
jgi:hypothetical protein